MKDPIKPYRGKCQGCGLNDWLDVGHLCVFCFAHMEPEARSTHIAHIRWVNAGRPADTDNPWE
jgi:hypothetical protein